jgi:hypothetical protein
MSTPYVYTSHERFSHDTLDSLGYDWSRVADPAVAPRFPCKIYTPHDTGDVVAAIREIRQLGQTLRVRSKGHSSNDLVLQERGAVLLTQFMNRVLDLDERQRTVTVQSGCVLAELDDILAGHGLGLPVIGDHNHITAGGFASVGGISPASHHHGMFVDNVVAAEYVDWDGNVHEVSRDGDPQRLDQVLGGTGRFGVITQLTLRVMPIDKRSLVLDNELRLYRNVHRFLADSTRFIAEPGPDVVMERGGWTDMPLPGGTSLRLGQFSQYRQRGQSLHKRLLERLSYGVLHGLGHWAGRLPAGVDQVVKYLGMAGVLLSPRHASYKNVEFFTDRILDSSVGDPTRMLIVLAPRDAYPVLFRSLYELSLNYRERHGCLRSISIYVKAIRSAYLERATGQAHHAEIMLYVGVDPERMSQELLEALVGEIDALCVQHGALRYMHTRTVKDEERLARIDPNRRLAGRPATAAAATASNAAAPRRAAGNGAAAPHP